MLLAEVYWNVRVRHVNSWMEGASKYIKIGNAMGIEGREFQAWKCSFVLQ